MTRRSFIYRDGKCIEVTDQDLAPREQKPVIIGEGDQRGYSFQLPLNYKYADTVTTKQVGGLEPGMPCWTSASKGEDIAKRAQDHGEPLNWERTRQKGKTIWRAGENG